MSRQDQYCNAQSVERSVKIAPIKCREISTIKTISGAAQVRLHRTIPMRATGNANPAFATDPGRVGPSSRHADDGSMPAAG
jgi:hypothetical protein